MLTKVTNAISQLSTICPMLTQLKEMVEIPFLHFFSVLLYPIDKWSFLKEDTQLPESIFNAFLTQSAQTPILDELRTHMSG